MADEKKDEYKVPDEEHQEGEKAKTGILEFIKSAWSTAQASFFAGKSGANPSMTEIPPVKSVEASKKTSSIAVITHLFKKDQARKAHEVLGSESQLANKEARSVEDKLAETLADEKAEAKEAVANKPESKKAP